MAELKSLPVTSAATRRARQAYRGSGAGKRRVSGAAYGERPGAPQPVQVLGNLARFEPGAELGTVSHYDVQPVLDIYANVRGNRPGHGDARDGEDHGEA